MKVYVAPNEFISELFLENSNWRHRSIMNQILLVGEWQRYFYCTIRNGPTSCANVICWGEAIEILMKGVKPRLALREDDRDDDG